MSWIAENTTVWRRGSLRRLRLIALVLTLAASSTGCSILWRLSPFFLFLDMESREGVGLAPDLWVPAADAVNYAVAAVRNGTIPTAQPVPLETLETDFAPETSWTMARKKTAILFLAVTVGGVIFATSNRKKPHIVAAVGAVSLVVSILWIISKRETPDRQNRCLPSPHLRSRRRSWGWDWV